jgi:hypothetical protein
MKQVIIGLMTGAVLTSSAFADLGDTIASSEAKYGKATFEPNLSHSLSYVHNG